MFLTIMFDVKVIAAILHGITNCLSIDWKNYNVIPRE